MTPSNDELSHPRHAGGPFITNCDERRTAIKLFLIFEQ
ncbi:MAG: hypothetical protein OJF62_001005 [Pseudolabrys sp.]|nr:hypothetical protein [Pseudolabrys sp.]